MNTPKSHTELKSLLQASVDMEENVENVENVTATDDTKAETRQERDAVASALNTINDTVQGKRSSTYVVVNERDGFALYEHSNDEAYRAAPFAFRTAQEAWDYADELEDEDLTGPDAPFDPSPAEMAVEDKYRAEGHDIMEIEAEERGDD